MKTSILKNVISAILLAAFIALTFSACGENGKNSTADNSSAINSYDNVNSNNDNDDTDKTSSDIKENTSSKKDKNNSSKTNSKTSSKANSVSSSKITSKTSSKTSSKVTSKTSSNTSSKTNSKEPASSAATSSNTEYTEKQKVLLGLDPDAYSESLDYSGNNARIANLMKNAQNGGEYTIAVYGGSISVGAGTSGIKNSYGYYVKEWWEKNFPKAKFNFISGGIGATDSEFACYRIKEDLLNYNPDFVMVDFAVNRAGKNILEQTYSTILHSILSHSTKTAILAIQFTNCDSDLYNSGIYKRNMRHPGPEINAAIGKYQIPSINYSEYVWGKINNQVIKWQDIGADYIHPNKNGHFLAAKLIENHLNYVKNNLKTLATAPPAIAALESNGFVGFTYITTSNCSGKVTANGFNVKDTSEFLKYHEWNTGKTGSTLTVKIPDNVKSVFIFLRIGSGKGNITLTENGENTKKVISDANMPIKTPTVIEFTNKGGTEITLTSDLEYTSSKDFLSVYGICYKN